MGNTAIAGAACRAGALTETILDNARLAVHRQLDDLIARQEIDEPIPFSLVDPPPKVDAEAWLRGIVLSRKSTNAARASAAELLVTIELRCEPSRGALRWLRRHATTDLEARAYAAELLRRWGL